MTFPRRSSRRRDHQRGFTLVELMVSLVLFSFAVAGVLSVAVSMTNGFREQRASVGTEVAARAALEFLSDAVRNASPGVSTAMIDDAHAPCAATVSAVEIVNSTTAPDEMTLTFAYGAFVTTTRSAYGSGSTSLAVTDFSGLVQGDSIVIAEAGGTRGIYGTIAQPVSSNTLTLGSQDCSTAVFPGSGAYPVGSHVIRAMRARFYISNLDGVPTLWMEPEGRSAEPLAEGIEDMQIAYARDTNGDGMISEIGAAANDDEWAFNVASDTALTVGTLRAVRITLIARATAPATGTARFPRIGAEDRAVSGTDLFRRRVLRTTVEIRNLGSL
jgi:prepilin-type N-terminal cleavage/methylation domain-containing protein